MSKTPQNSTLDDIESTVKLKLLDALGRGIDKLDYEIRDGEKIVAKGKTGSDGSIQSFTSQIGTKLKVHVMRFASNEMKHVRTLIPWAEDYNVKLKSGKVKETVAAKPTEGNAGGYKRKTYVVQPRDTLDSIAAANQTTVEALVRLNGIDSNKIWVGQVLKLPNDAQGAPAKKAEAPKSAGDTVPSGHEQAPPQQAGQPDSAKQEAPVDQPNGPAQEAEAERPANPENESPTAGQDGVPVPKSEESASPESASPSVKPDEMPAPRAEAPSRPAGEPSDGQSEAPVPGADESQRPQDELPPGKETSTPAKDAEQPDSAKTQQPTNKPDEPAQKPDGQKNAKSESPAARPPVPIVPKPVKAEDRGKNGTPKTSLDLKCSQTECIKLGSTGPLVEEINIRLMGFGGSVQSDKPLTEFTADTEAAVKQFQRDYMNVPETGRVCGAVLRALDDFRTRYTFTLTPAMKCPCGQCGGFGRRLKRSSDIKYLPFIDKHKTKRADVEGTEYPGMHRSLFWLVRAAFFYIQSKDAALGFHYSHVSSGYRCWTRNQQTERGSTNHMGKALDIQFKTPPLDSSGKPKAGTQMNFCTSTNRLNELREKIFVNRLGATMGWRKNRTALERDSDGANKWVHIDVREFRGTEFNKDKYYVVTPEDANGIPLMEMAKNAGLLSLYNCGGVPPPAKKEATGRLPIDSLELSNKGLEFIKAWEDFSPTPYDAPEGNCTVGYGHKLLANGRCSAAARDPKSDYHKFKNGINETQALAILRADVKRAEVAVRKTVHVPLHQHEYDALVALAFNCGGLSRFPKLLNKVNTGNYPGCCSEFADITNNGLRGLVKRRAAEMNMFGNNNYDSTH